MDAALELLFKSEREARAAGRIGCEPEELMWYSCNFVEWLSEIGHHIELTGDEFDMFHLPDRFA